MKSQKLIQDQWAYEVVVTNTKRALVNEMQIAKIDRIRGGLIVTTASGHAFKFTIDSVDQAAVDSLISQAAGDASNE